MRLAVITFLTIGGCYSARLFPRDDNGLTDLQKLKVISPMKRNSTSPLRNITSSQTRRGKSHVERVTNNEFEIINFIWKKSKVFENVKSTTTGHKKNVTISDLIQRKQPINFAIRPPFIHSFTPSYMEFYYLDESGDQDEKKNYLNMKCQMKCNEKSSTMSLLSSSLSVFHKYKSLFTKANILVPTSQSPFSISHSSVSMKSINKPVNSKFKTIPGAKTNTPSLTRKTFEAYLKQKQSVRKDLKDGITQSMSDITIMKCYDTESTTVYDKIKFFELYDKYTRIPLVKKDNFPDAYYNDDEIEINNTKIQLEDVDQSSHEHKEARLAKKHVNNKTVTIEENIKSKTNFTVAEHQNTNGSFVKSDTKESISAYSYINKSVSWSKYPFAAVFVYEPSHVHCEAASISPHWLVASGSCLSRMNQSPVLGDGRSAFVAYCGEYWWYPERVSYVKYSVVHPWYHPKDLKRKHLYNIGVIRVVTSMMSACSEWAPVSLMSHQFGVNQEGSEALALGWGLDRYDTRYSSMGLPKSSLMIYKSLVFTDSCPGNIEHGVKRFGASEVLKNVYCLSLPPYSREESDPVHGSLLLIGGKLIALYLQEERRPWGEQSAQYTGIWHLIPWVAEVAKEPEEIELFAVEI